MHFESVKTCLDGRYFNDVTLLFNWNIKSKREITVVTGLMHIIDISEFHAKNEFEVSYSLVSQRRWRGGG